MMKFLQNNILSNKKNFNWNKLFNNITNKLKILIVKLVKQVKKNINN